MSHVSPAISGTDRRLAYDSVVAVLEHLAHTKPNSPALRSAVGVQTFAQLWDGALTVADVLVESGVEPGDRVGLWADRTPSVLTALLGIMVAGAAYVPLDPTYPTARIEAILQAAGLTTFVFDGSSPITPGTAGLDLSALSGGSSAHVRTPPPRGADAAYVVFTSGSTGRPKGVVVEHASLLNYSCWCASLAGAGATPLFGSLGFDHTITSLWPTLIRGEPVVLFGGAWDQGNLFRAREVPFSLVKVTPSHLRFFERTGRPDYRGVTRMLMSGGEPLDPAQIKAIGNRVDGVRLVNHFGPTETTVGCCYFEFNNRELPVTPTVPIGRPIWNTRAYVLDDNLDPVGPGQPGELVIAGAGVARGYLEQSAAADRFVDEADLGGTAGRAYRTGDRVRRLPDGNLLHLGRSDDQIKVNGYRIELGELRAHAMAAGQLDDVAFEVVRGTVDRVDVFAVAARRAGGRDAAGRLAAEVRRSLAAALPPGVGLRRVHMVPEIAVNTHGKRDLRATRQRLSRRGE